MIHGMDAVSLLPSLVPSPGRNSSHPRSRASSDLPHQAYNDVGAWDYDKLPAAMGAQEGEYKTYDIKTKQQLLDLLQDEEFATGNILRWVVMHMPKKDAPAPLKEGLAGTAKMNKEMKGNS